MINERKEKRKHLQKQIVRKTLPLLVAQCAYAFLFSGFLLNILQLSYIFWEDNTFHPIEMGMAVAVQNWAVAFAGLILGRFVDRFSRKNMMVITMIISFIGRGSVGLLPTGDPMTYPLLLITMTIAGFGRGGFMPIILSLSNDILEKEERSQFFAIFESSAQIFNILGMIIGTALIQYGF